MEVPSPIWNAEERAKIVLVEAAAELQTTFCCLARREVIAKACSDEQACDTKGKTMETSVTPQKMLSVPDAGRAHYEKNFIRLAACELRFPTLFEVEAETPPLALSKALRKEYPTHELLKNVAVNLGGVAHSNAHAFRSRKGRWSVTLRPSTK